MSANIDTAPPIKSIPNSIEAERAVLGSILIDPDAIGRIAGKLKPADFYRERHTWIYAAMLALHDRNEPIDFVTLADEIECEGQMEDIGGPVYLTDLIAGVPTSINVDYYANIVARTAQLRQLILAAGKIAEVAYAEEQPLEEVFAQAEAALQRVTQDRPQNNIVTLAQSYSGLFDRIDYLARNRNIIMGVPTGFTNLDRLLGGLQRSDLIILAARPAMGKSAMAMQIGYNASKRYNAHVAAFSLEMSHEQLTQRILSVETGIDGHRLRLGQIADDEWDLLVGAGNVFENLNLWIDDTPAQTVSDIRTKCRRLHAEHGLDLIIIDYIQLMSAGGNSRPENRQQEISHISRSLKALARELNVPVLALSQLSRAVESRADKRPMLSDLRESGALEQDADVVGFIYRDDYYNEESEQQNMADVIVAKHRHGSTGTVTLYFRKELSQFRDLEIMRTELEY